MIYLDQTKIEVRLADLIAPSFYDLYWDVIEHHYTHYKLKGGRGSTKSSFISIMIILGMMNDPEANAACFRKVGNTLQESVYEQLLWAIDALKVNHLWHPGITPLRITYKPTGQRIVFRGMDDPNKAKSIKVRKGYFKYIWFEERAEMDGEEDERKVLQSMMRGGKDFTVFYSWNPPKSINSWVNQDILFTDEDTIVHSSDYRSVPPEWLGEPFIKEAEKLKNTKPIAYRHEYLGEAVGTGGQVFDNVTVRRITSEEIERFDKVGHGLDFGFAADPLAYVKNHFDKTRRRLFIFGEVYQVNLSNAKAVAAIKRLNPLNQLVVADSEDPRSINEFHELGLKITGAKKGPGSVEHGIKWLQDLDEIIIDPVLCPNTAREFTGYELEKDKNGNFKGSYPDKNNHAIDATRYSREEDMTMRKAKIRNKVKRGIR